VHQIAAFYYGKAGPHLDLGNGRHFTIDSSWNEQLNFRQGKEKAKWVAGKAKEVFQDFKKTKASTVLLNATNNHTSLLHPGEQIANVRDASHPCSKANTSLSAVICKSAEVHLAPSSGASLLDTIKSRLADTVSNVVVNRDSNTEGAIPHVEPALSTLDEGFIEPVFPTTEWADDAVFLGADQDTDFSVEYLLEGNIEECAHELNDFDVSSIEVASSLLAPGSATVNEEDCGPCTSQAEGTILNDIQDHYPDAAVSDVMIDEGSQQKSLPLGLQEDEVDALSLFTDANLCNQHSIADRLLEVASLYQQRIKEQDKNLVDYERENSELKRRNFELEREVKRLKGI